MKHIKPTILSLAVCTLAACSSSKINSLEFPPHLNDIQQNNAYNLHQSEVTASDAQSTQELQITNRADIEYAKLEVNHVLVYGAPARNVNRIGAALDRIGLSVQQFVPERSMFLVRPAPQEAVITEEKSGFLGGLFGSKKKVVKLIENEAPQMFVFLEAAKETEQRIHLLDQFGKPYEGKDANRWLNELYKELR